MARYSLDTSTISHILRKDWSTVHRFRAAYDADHEFLLCPVVYYELRRGFEKTDAKKQMSEMEEIVAQFRWQEFDIDVWKKAAQGWAEAKRKGQNPGEADLLIAHHAYHFDAILVTANVKDFQIFPGQIENWTSSVAAPRQ